MFLSDTREVGVFRKKFLGVTDVTVSIPLRPDSCHFRGHLLLAFTEFTLVVLAVNLSKTIAKTTLCTGQAAGGGASS